MAHTLLASAFAPITPTPAGYTTSDTTAWVFTIWGGGVAIALLPFVLRAAWRRNPVPLLVFLGGFACSLQEAQFDALCHLWWATNLPGPVWSGFNTDIPLLIPFCYAATIGLESYAVGRLLARGLSGRQVWLLWLAICASDMLLEYPGVLLDAYRYYGDQPFEFARFPWWFAWVNGTGVFLVGVALWFLVPRLRGWNRLVLAVVPPLVFGATWGALAWPNLMALNWRLGDVAAWAVSAVSLALAVVVVALARAAVARPARDDERLTLPRRLSFAGR